MAKPIDIESDLVPIGRFKAKAAALLESLDKDGRTLVITQNGTAAAVVMGPHAYERLKYRERLVEELARGLADADEGATRTTSQVRKDLAARRRHARKK